MIFVKQDDRRPAATGEIKRGTTAVDLTDATSVTFKARHFHSVSTSFEGAATINDAVAGEVSYLYAATDTADAGDYYVSWVVTWSDGTTETFPTLSFDVLRIDPNIEE